jgi:hypothetical protein
MHQHFLSTAGKYSSEQGPGDQCNKGGNTTNMKVQLYTFQIAMYQGHLLHMKQLFSKFIVAL